MRGAVLRDGQSRRRGRGDTGREGGDGEGPGRGAVTAKVTAEKFHAPLALAPVPV